LASIRANRISGFNFLQLESARGNALVTHDGSVSKFAILRQFNFFCRQAAPFLLVKMEGN